MVGGLGNGSVGNIGVFFVKSVSDAGKRVRKIGGLDACDLEVDFYGFVLAFWSMLLTVLGPKTLPTTISLAGPQGCKHDTRISANPIFWQFFHHFLWHP